MSLATPAYEQTTYLLTRRCVQRQFWLRPTRTLNELFGYALARAAKEHGAAVHNAVVLANHWHAVISVSEAVASEFARDVHAVVARGLNRQLDRCEALWSSDGLSLVRLVDADAVFEKMVYTEVNAVAARLVKWPSDWGGLRITPREALRDEPRRFRRPKTFYRKGRRATCPEVVELEVGVPPCFGEEDEEAFVGRFEAAVKRQVKSLHAEAKARGWSYMGMRKVRAQRRSRSPEATEPRGVRRPRIACGDPVLRRRAREELVEFRACYAASRKAWLRGGGPVMFPAGTNQMRGYPNVVVEGGERGKHGERGKRGERGERGRARPPDAGRAIA